MSSNVTPSTIRRWDGYLPHVSVNKWKYWILTVNNIVATWRLFRTRMQKIPMQLPNALRPASYKVKGSLRHLLDHLRSSHSYFNYYSYRKHRSLIRAG
jgi:hypothetical protein